MTDDPRAQLQQIRDRAEAATEGPWYANDRGIGYEIGREPKSDEPGFWPATINEGLRETFEKTDATFIGHARTDVPRLVGALQAVLDRHQPFEWSFGYGPVKSCKACADEGKPQEKAAWPCPDYKAVTAAMGGGE